MLVIVKKHEIKALSNIYIDKNGETNIIKGKESAFINFQ